MIIKSDDLTFNTEKFKNSPVYKFALAHKLIVFGFLVSTIAVIVLSSTMLANAIYFNDPSHKDVELEAWMTPRYVLHSYDLPRPVLMELLGIDEDTKNPRRLDKVAQNIGLTLDELTVKIRAAAATYRVQKVD